MSEKNSAGCPCCSGESYANCCGPFISGEKLPDKPELLMRSRYTAYSKANVDYIAKTMKGPASQGFDKQSAKLWASAAEWVSLKVLRAYEENSKGYVEFIATYRFNDKLETLHELSEFIHENGRWYYFDGKLYT